MTMSKAIWEQTQNDLVRDFLDLSLPPTYNVPVEKDYPRSSNLVSGIKSLATNIEIPENKLILPGQFIDESTMELFSNNSSDWAVLFTFELLRGFDIKTEFNLPGGEFDGLRKIAILWGQYLEQELIRVFRNFEFFSSLADVVLDILYQITKFPATEWGDLMRGSATPAYIRAGQILTYQFAVLDGDSKKIRESQYIIQASDTEIQREINGLFRGYSSKELGLYTQHQMINIVSSLQACFSSEQFKEHYIQAWTTVARQISWFLGCRLRQNMLNDRGKVNRLLQAVNRHQEIDATMEQYRFKHNWHGDRNKAIRLGWGVVAPKCFQLNTVVEQINKDEDQAKLIGISQGLEDYVEKNPAINALGDGFIGKLQSYLKKAAINQEIDYYRKQRTKGNLALTEALYIDDLHNVDMEEDSSQNEDEILSNVYESHYHSEDAVAVQAEINLFAKQWFDSLTEKEKTAVELKIQLDNEQLIAKEMGISQQRVSQLLLSANKKWKIMRK